MTTHESVRKILERSRMLRQQTEAMLADRRFQALQPRHSREQKRSSMLDTLANEMVSVRSAVFEVNLKQDIPQASPAWICCWICVLIFQRELRRDNNSSLKLQMQHLYTAIRDVSDQLRRDWSFEDDMEIALETDGAGCREEQSPMITAITRQQQQRHTSAAAADDRVFHSGTMPPILENRGSSCDILELRGKNWFQSPVEMRLVEFTSSGHATNNQASHWADSFFKQTTLWLLLPAS